MTTSGLGLSAYISAYIDVATFARSPHGLDTSDLVGLSTTTAGATQPSGTTNLAVASSSGYTVDSAWILDGPYSEVVSITGSADGTHVSLASPGTLFAHSSGVCVAQGGALGSLPEILLRASAFAEEYCQQGTAATDRSLFAVARTELWGMPSARAYLDRDSVVCCRPGHFPVQSVSAASIQFGQGQSLALDVTQLQNTGGRLVELPYLLQTSPTVGVQLLLENRGLSRSRRQWLSLTYTGGFTPGSVPYGVAQAVTWIASDLVAQRLNPTGASELDLGKRRVVQRQRGDVVGDSILLLRARDMLDPYRSEMWG